MSIIKHSLIEKFSDMIVILDDEQCEIFDIEVAMVVESLEEYFIVSICMDILGIYEFSIFSFVWYICIVHTIYRKISSLGIQE